MKVSDKGHELISVSLKSLLSLAGPATSLNLAQSGRRAAQSGQYLSRFKGRGMEFDEARPYQAGDDVRSIDWRVTARTGRTHTKIFREEREQPVFISVDHRAAMAFATRGVFKSVQAARLAALLAWSARNQGDRVGGQLFSDQGCLELKPRHGKHAVLSFLNSLVHPLYTQEGEVSLSHALSRLVQHARPGSRVYFISDFRGMDEAFEQHLARLTRHCEVVFIQVYDSIEASLPSRGVYRFTDGQQDCLVDTRNIEQLKRYQQRYQDHWQRLKKVTRRHKVSLLSCNTVEPPLDAFRPARPRTRAS